MKAIRTGSKKRSSIDVRKVSGVVTAILAAAGAAHAQEASTDPSSTSGGNEIAGEAVVRGIRASIERSIAVKKEADSVVEVISAEDIGKLPDSSIAEALARLPGLAGQRLDGRQSSVAIRGLGEDFSTATLNGREQVSIGDNRGVEFDIYPSEIMSGVSVYKTPDASMTTQGLGGTIDMQTIRPLSAPESISLNFNFERNSLGKLNPSSDDQGWRGTFSYIDQFADDRLGIALAVAKLHSPSQEERWNAWGYPTDEATGAFVAGGAKPFVRSSMLDRETFVGVAEFAPNDAVRITADALYIDFQDDKTLRGIELPGAIWGGHPYSISTVTDGLATSGVWQDVKVQVRNDFERRSAKLKSFSSNVAFELAPSWTAAVDVSHSDVNRDIVSLESYSSTGRVNDPNAARDNLGFTMTPGRGIRFSPTLDYSDDTLIQLGGGLAWGNGVTVASDAQDGFVNFPHIEDELNTARVSTALEIDAGRVNRVEFGLSYADREKQKVDNGTFLTLQDFPGTSAIPAQFLLPDTSLDFIGMGSMVSYDSYGLWKSGFYKETSENLTVATRSINTWTVNEKVAIAYAKAGFDLDIGSRSLGGNFGLQLVQTDQSSDGSAVGLENGFVVSQPNSGGDKFTDVLPSLNTAFHLSDTQQIRFGAARVLSRSRMDRMNASYGYTFDVTRNVPGATPETSPWSGNGANPSLRPQKSDQFDLSFENYFNREGYFSVGLFYKDLKNWQTTVNQVVDFSGITPPGGAVAQYNQGLVSTWVNSDGGSVSGAEFQAAIPAGLFTPALEGFGALFAATYLESKILVDGDEAPVPGLSKNIYNITLYYEQRGFGARLSGSKRSAFLGEVYTTSFVRTFVNVNGTELLDAQLSYDFSDSDFERLRGLKVMLQAQNLTNEPFSTFQLEGDPRLVRDYQNYGTNYLLGFSYKF